MYTIGDIRRRPGMYIGSTGPTGIHRMILELVSNSLDQVLGGRAHHIWVTSTTDGSVSVHDDGPGIPVDAIGASGGLTFLERVMTIPRDTPTADGHSPHVHLSMGRGLGLVPICALSSTLEVLIDNGSTRYRQVFSRGSVVSPLESLGPSHGSTGSTITFTPDPWIFESSRCDEAALAKALRELALLTPGLTTSYNGLSSGPVDDLSEMFSDMLGGLDQLLHKQPFVLRHQAGSAVVNIVLGWRNRRRTREIRTFCNFWETLTKGFDHLGIEEGFRLVFGQAPVGEVFDGLVMALHLTMLDPTFGNPTGRSLYSPEAIWLVADTIANELPRYLDQNPNLKSELQSRVPLR